MHLEAQLAVSQPGIVPIQPEILRSQMRIMRDAAPACATQHDLAHPLQGQGIPSLPIRHGSGRSHLLAGAGAWWCRRCLSLRAPGLD